MNNVPCVITWQVAMEYFQRLRGGSTPLAAAHHMLAAQYRRARAELNCADSFVAQVRFVCFARQDAQQPLACVRCSSAWGRILAPLLQTGGFVVHICQPTNESNYVSPLVGQQDVLVSY